MSTDTNKAVTVQLEVIRPIVRRKKRYLYHTWNNFINKETQYTARVKGHRSYRVANADNLKVGSKQPRKMVRPGKNVCTHEDIAGYNINQTSDNHLLCSLQRTQYQ